MVRVVRVTGRNRYYSILNGQKFLVFLCVKLQFEENFISNQHKIILLVSLEI